MCECLSLSCLLPGRLPPCIRKEVGARTRGEKGTEMRDEAKARGANHADVGGVIVLRETGRVHSISIHPSHGARGARARRRESGGDTQVGYGAFVFDERMTDRPGRRRRIIGCWRFRVGGGGGVVAHLNHGAAREGRVGDRFPPGPDGACRTPPR